MLQKAFLVSMSLLLFFSCSDSVSDSNSTDENSASYAKYNFGSYSEFEVIWTKRLERLILAEQQFLLKTMLIIMFFQKTKQEQDFLFKANMFLI